MFLLNVVIVLNSKKKKRLNQGLISKQGNADVQHTEQFFSIITDQTQLQRETGYLMSLYLLTCLHIQ